ncbi:hypothetical protein PhaeoP66_03224 [Phaeobacter inhibens]|uniref:Uncharacterized protein n=1 Tax=Phaeobacter inhibens TaxID=221822 RepID=A0ABM6RIC7_9RHOB|nr:hypothetical protein [Phaeobacter inhibens]AUQ95966.1 hypothetical protein PhaeoP66_03224 [Phaeobacter inhibens]
MQRKWKLRSAAGCGALIGLGYAAFVAFTSHDAAPAHSEEATANLAGVVLGGGIGGALLGVAVAIVRNQASK